MLVMSDRFFETSGYEGTFIPDADETLNFKIACDDGFRLIVDGDIASCWQASGVVTALTGIGKRMADVGGSSADAAKNVVEVKIK